MPLGSIGGSQSTRIVCLETGMAWTLLGGPGTETENLFPYITQGYKKEN